MTGTELDVTWETTQDGKALTELMGDRAEILWDMDHSWVECAWTVVGVVFAMVIVTVLVMFLWASAPKPAGWYDGSRFHIGDSSEMTEQGKRKDGLVEASIVIAGIAITAILVLAVHGNTLDVCEMDLSRVDARIDLILARHPEWSL